MPQSTDACRGNEETVLPKALKVSDPPRSHLGADGAIIPLAVRFRMYLAHALFVRLNPPASLQ